MAWTDPAKARAVLTGIANQIPWNWVAVIAALGVVATQLSLAIGPISGIQQDFCVYQTGVSFAWSGVWPYDLELVQTTVEDRLGIAAADRPFPCGFFGPPLSFITLAPWGWLPWVVADSLWVALLLLGALSCGSLTWTFDRETGQMANGWGVVIAVVLLNPLVQRSISLGQTGLYFCGAVALGQWAFERKHSILGSLLWGFTGLKPHLALPLLAVACYSGGWRRLLAIGAVMGIYWSAGCLLFGDPIRVTTAYLAYLGTAHKSIGFNRVTNDQIISWNRLIAAAGGPLFDLSLLAMISGLVIAGFLLWAVQIRRHTSPPVSWMLAACVIWGLLTVQVLGYDLVLLALTIPYILRLGDRGRYTDLALLLLALAVVSIPRGVVVALGTTTGFSHGLPLLLSYRTIALVGAAIHILVREPAV